MCVTAQLKSFKYLNQVQLPSEWKKNWKENYSLRVMCKVNIDIYLNNSCIIID